MTSTRTGPGAVARIAPDAAQAAAIDAIRDAEADVLVLGAPGTGKSGVVVEAAVAAIAGGMDPSRTLVLAPTRQSAARLRDRITGALDRPSGAPLARTAASVAFSVLRAVADAEGRPAPALISGAEQDVMLAEILEGHRREDGRVPSWEGLVPPEATLLPGFREEVRNLLMRAAESGLGPDALQQLGEDHRQPAWVAGADVMRDYLDATLFAATAGDIGDRFDPAEVVSEAAFALDAWDPRTLGARPGWELIIVDDFQDGTAATAALLRVLAGQGARIALVGNADQATQGFRGAAPQRMLAAVGGFRPVTSLSLDAVHRQHGALAAATGAVAERIGIMAGATSRSAAARGHDGPAPDAAVDDAAVAAGADDQVTVLVAPHRYGQARAIAAELRRSRHQVGDEVAWGRMAVVARSAAQLRELRSDLIALDIPCETLGDGTALRDEPAVAPLLRLLDAAVGTPWTEDSASEVLMSRIGGLDPVGVRRLRRALLQESRAGGEHRTSAELLVEAMSDPALFASIPGPEARAAGTLAAAARDAAQRASAPGPTPGAVIWAAWSRLGLADAWRDGALAGSSRDDADLDAVIALLRAAQTFTERMPSASTAAFLRYLDSQEFAADTLGARAMDQDAVAFATPASAAGREWDVVAIAGVEEGAWPDLRIRDSVLGAQRLADLLEGRARDGAGVGLHAARAQVLDDETRALLVAVSRARRRLVVTAVNDADTRPSRYVELIARAAGVERQETSEVRHVADLRTAVARARERGLASPEDPGLVELLGDLAVLGLPGAHPDAWHGRAETSTREPFWEDDAAVKVSPSKYDLVRTCALRWALESVGGTPEGSTQINVGLLVHSIAAEHPDAGEDELLAALDDRWHEVGGRDTWVERGTYDSAREMIGRLARYLASHGADEVRVEQPFGVEVGRARVSGSADRIEIFGDAARVVDLKTGRAISVADAAEHGQLKLYQLAANLGAFDGVETASGASLVFIGSGSGASGSLRAQGPIDTDAVSEELGATVETMAGAVFTATPNARCASCPIRRSCPAHAEGDQVTDR